MENKQDIWEEACKLLNLPLEVKNSFLWIYRLHTPDIEMGVREKKAFEDISSIAKHTAILTDGRSISQRQKLKSLGLLDHALYISQEYQSVKPSTERFTIIMNELPAENFIYFGDNPTKDFQAPNLLKWTTICLYPSYKNIHSYKIEEIEEPNLPEIWVHSLQDLKENILKLY